MKSRRGLRETWHADNSRENHDQSSPRDLMATERFSNPVCRSRPWIGTRCASSSRSHSRVGCQLCHRGRWPTDGQLLLCLHGAISEDEDEYGLHSGTGLSMAFSIPHPAEVHVPSGHTQSIHKGGLFLPKDFRSLEVLQNFTPRPQRIVAAAYASSCRGTLTS